jgi:hypothetical protein
MRIPLPSLPLAINVSGIEAFRKSRPPGQVVAVTPTALILLMPPAERSIGGDVGTRAVDGYNSMYVARRFRSETGLTALRDQRHRLPVRGRVHFAFALFLAVTLLAPLACEGADRKDSGGPWIVASAPR